LLLCRRRHALRQMPGQFRFVCLRRLFHAMLFFRLITPLRHACRAFVAMPPSRYSTPPAYAIVTFIFHALFTP